MDTGVQARVQLFAKEKATPCYKLFLVQVYVF